MADEAGPALRCRGVSKSYAGNRVLTSFEMSIGRGEVHALLGENGSGKSTFIKILAGVVAPDAGGEVVVAGRELTFGSPAASADLGVRFVHQDLGLVSELSVLDNMLLVSGFATGRLGSIRTRACTARVRENLDRIGLDVDPRTLVGDLSPASRTGVAVARALDSADGVTPYVLVLDEPTATLPDDEVLRLLDVVRGAQANGLGILYVTHRLDEVFDLGGTVTVLRDGHRIATQPSTELSKKSVIALMAGEELTSELSDDARREATAGAERLVVRDVCGASVDQASFTVRSGEIIGIAGITGSGREALLPLLFGSLPRDAGEVLVDGDRLPAARPGAAVAHGMGYVPPDRKIGGFAALSVQENATIARLRPFSSRLRIRRGAERTEAQAWTERMDVRPAGALDRPFSSLSGGNQQKVLFAKWLRLGLKVFLLDEPTQGVDVNAKALLHRHLVAAAEEGLATLVASTDVDELAALCDRILVFRQGRIAAELEGAQVTSRTIALACVESETKVLS